jgi:lipopolysaccharide/colanic/teichoic acid biosynthesis glycosyltransferase
MKLLRVTTVPMSLAKLLSGQLRFMQRQGYEVVAVSGDGPEIALIKEREQCRHVVVPMTRTISPLKDLLSLYYMIRLIRREKPDIVHTHTPKAGLIGMMAAMFCGVPLRLHTVAGLPLMEARGLKRSLLVFAERITYRCSNMVYPNSMLLRSYILKHICADALKIKVLGNGSSNGIDVGYFNPGRFDAQDKARLRERLNIAEEDVVYCFVGRMVADKGIIELVSAFTELEKDWKHVKLLLVGGLEQELYPLNNECLQRIQTHNAIKWVGYQDDVRPYLSISNALVFPSYREGFPNVVMQAGAMGVPCIVSDINGCNEIIVNEENGIIIPVKNRQQLLNAMLRLVKDRTLLDKMATRSREMIVSRYEQHYLWQALLQEYQSNGIRTGIPGMYQRTLKVGIDFIVALALLILLSPVFLFLLLLLTLTTNGHPFFVQRRPGLHGKIFRIIKFRTMNNRRDINGRLLSDAQRLTPLGKLLRKTSLDEIPQLINVLKGDMSLVGPRPLLTEYLPLYSPEQQRRHNVRPGITGWAQVNGRNAISWEQKFAYDVWYADHVSLKLDIRILWLTVLKVGRSEGISQQGHATAQKFKGNALT